jgi:predicted metal-dependent phosphoesterase TrpH
VKNGIGVFLGAHGRRDEVLESDPKSEKRWLKAEMHAHCNLDPDDYRMCSFTPQQLIFEGARLGFEVLSITCHNIDIWTDSLADYASSLGVILIPGMEVSAERTRHILTYNFNTAPENLDTIPKIRARSRTDTLVIAPHPYFPGSTCLGSLLEKNLDVFDAIECSGFHVPGLNFNRKGWRLTAKAHKPMVAFGDVHHLWQLGRTFTWIYAEPDAQSVLQAVKEGFVRMELSPLSWFEAAEWWATALWRNAFPVNPAPVKRPLNKIEDGRCFGAAQKSMKPQRIHIGQ